MSRKRWLWTGALALAVLALGWIAWSLKGPYDYARIATGYAAKQTCSCLHISGRALDSCVSDIPGDVRQLHVIAEANQVSASVLFGAVRAEAVYEDGYGCRLTN